ncbi:MAG: hypothetical protein FRX48_09754 [Lasallia pustulata]|uniref:Apple domain-containing protein n=1 Tax=Lasallia pustulata TaxID=136370 RepID=A0A5M8PBP6_9LECA|nr:MAG: hypothetical protein FRX48_09754 [Lasallia pustulata]
MRSRYDIAIRQGIEVPNQGIEVVPSPGKIPYRHDDAEKLNTSQFTLEKRRPCGLSFVGFWVGIVIIAFVLFGAAIGGGVGVGLAAQRKSTPNAASGHSVSSFMTTTASSTSSQPPWTTITEASTLSATASAPYSSSMATTTSSTSSQPPSTTNTKASTPSASACPAADGTTYVPLILDTSQPYRFNGSVLAYTVRCKTDYAGGAAFGNPSGVDLQTLPNVGSLDSCIDACATYSNQLPQTANASACCVAVGWIPAQDCCYLKSGVTSSSYNNTGNLATYTIGSAIQVGL